MKVHLKRIIVQFIRRIVRYVFTVYLINCPSIINAVKNIIKYHEPLVTKKKNRSINTELH